MLLFCNFLVHQISSNAAGQYNIFVSNTEGNKLTMILLLHIFKDAEIQTSIATKMFLSYLNLVIAWTSMEVTQMERHAVVKPQPFSVEANINRVVVPYNLSTTKGKKNDKGNKDGFQFWLKHAITLDLDTNIYT